MDRDALVQFARARGLAMPATTSADGHPQAAVVGKRRERAKVRQDPDTTRKYKLKGAYGITHADYEAMYKQQGGCCAICGDAKEPWEPGSGLKGRQRFLVVDHDHETLQVRALLCWNCNCGLGQFREDPAVMQAAIAYLAEQAIPLAA